MTADDTGGGIVLSRVKRVGLLTLGLLVCLLGLNALPAYAQSITYASNCTSNNVSVIYTATHEIKNPPVRDTVPVRQSGVTTPYCPGALVFTPYNIHGNANGQSAYTANALTDNVSVIDTATGKLLPGSPISLTSGLNPGVSPGENPVAIAMAGVCLNPLGGQCDRTNPLAGTFAYVVNKDTDNVSVIDTDPSSPTYNKVVKSIAVGDAPSAVAVSKPILEQAPGNAMRFSAGFFVYVTNSGDNTVSVIGADRSPSQQLNYHNVITTVPLGPAGGDPSAVAFDRTSDWAYVATRDGDNVFAIDSNTHTVSGAPIPLPAGANPHAIAITRDYTGSIPCRNFRAYVTNTGTDSFTVINVEQATPAGVACADFQKVVTTTPLKPGDAPMGASIVYPDEDFVYIANSGSDTVSVIDADPDSNPAQYNFEVGRVPVGDKPMDVQNTPRIPYAYVANSGSNTLSLVGASPQIGDPHPLLDTIPLSFSPSWLSLHRNQDFMLMADFTGRKIHALNTISLEVLPHTSPVLVGNIVGLGMPPDGCCMYVSTTSNRLYAISVESGQLTLPTLARKATILNFCNKPKGLDVHPDNFFGYVACWGSNEVVIINTHKDLGQGGQGSGFEWNETVGRVALPGKRPINVGMSHVGHRALVMNSNNTISLINTAEGTPNYHKVLKHLILGPSGTKGPTAVAFNEDDEYAYVTNSVDGTVSVVKLHNASPWATLYATIQLGETPQQSALKNPQGIFINLGERTAAYVANKGTDSVSIIDVQKTNPTWNTVLPEGRDIPVGDAPVGVIITEP